MVKHSVPAYSQHLHVKNKKWRRKSCGIISLKMLLEFFNKKIEPEELLELGLELGAYLPNIGWKHKGLADIGKNYGFKGKNFDFSKESISNAFKKAKSFLQKYPILASIHLDFNPKNDGHLIVLTGFSKDKIFYNDPNQKSAEKIQKSVNGKKFLKGWKKRIIVIRSKNKN